MDIGLLTTCAVGGVAWGAGFAAGYKAAGKKEHEAEGKRVPEWLDLALLLQLEEKLLDMFNGKPGFGGGEDNVDVAVGGVVLFDYDVTFCADINLSPVAWGDGVCGVHAFTIQVCVRGGRVVSYEIKGRNKNEFFVRIMPQGQDVKNS